jgi:hypothetical protein
MECLLIWHHLTYLPIHYIQGGSTLTIFAFTRFLIIEKILRLARTRHTYGPIILSIKIQFFLSKYDKLDSFTSEFAMTYTEGAMWFHERKIS